MLEGWVEMDLVKVSGVAEWPTPWNKKEVQSFVGFVNFYQRFIKDFSHHACTLFDLMLRVEYPSSGCRMEGYLGEVSRGSE